MQSRTPDLDEQLARLQGVLPSYLAKTIHFLRAPGLRWLRTATGILLILCSLFWFLPIVGLEMFPLGLMLLAIDIPFLRGPVARLIDWIEQAVIRMMTAWEAVGARVRGTR